MADEQRDPTRTPEREHTPQDPEAGLAALVKAGIIRLGRGDWRDEAMTSGEPTSIASERLAELRGDAGERLGH